MMHSAHYPAVDDELLKTLPPVLRAVVKALGYGRAKDWLTDHGGRNVTVPVFRTTALDLEPDELERLREMLEPHMDATGRVTLPKPDKLYLRVRDAQMRKDRHNASLTELAGRYHLTTRQITNICRESDDSQLGLF